MQMLHDKSAQNIRGKKTRCRASALQTGEMPIQKTMPKEDRLIIFSNEEVYKALYALSAQKQLKKPPAGVITKIEEVKGDRNTICLHLSNPQESFDSDKKLDYTRDFLAAALMLFCRGLGIPLPKSARKSVMLRNGEVMLRVQI